MAIDTMDEIVAAMSSGAYRKTFMIPTLTAKAGGSYQGAYTAAGFPGVAGSQPPPVGTPGTVGQGGAIPVNADSRFRFTNPTSPVLSYLARFAATMNVSGTIVLFDRLWHDSGLSGTSTSAQNVNSIPLTRPDANGADVEPWIQIYTATGSTAVTATISYTNQAGTSGRTGTTSTLGFIATPVVGQMFPISLQAGDTGVRTIQTLTLSATTGTAGNFGLVLLRRLATITNVANLITERDIFDLGMPQIYDSACLDLMAIGSSNTLGPMSGDMEIIQG